MKHAAFFRYIKDFISVHPSASAYKLQGEILEQLKEGNKALESYKRAYEIDESDNIGVLSKSELISFY